MAKLYLNKISLKWILKLHSKNISTLTRSLFDLSPQAKKHVYHWPKHFWTFSLSQWGRFFENCCHLKLIAWKVLTASKSTHTRNRCYDKSRNCSRFSMKMLICSICSLLLFCFFNVSATSNGTSQFVDRELNKNVAIQEGKIGTENTVRC